MNFPPPPVIELTNVSVRRESTLILDQISLTIPSGQHTCLLGPNGAGKSSLLKLLTRDFYPSIATDGHQGEMRILGESQWEVAELRRRMGIISPELERHFGSGRTGRMTVFETVASGYTSTRLREFGPKLDAANEDRIREITQFVAVDALLDRRVATLSSGERRRTLIARALVHQPSILVLDEPTNGLDLAARQVFLDVIERISEQEETTLVLVTHHLSEIPPKLNHVVLLKGGRIVAKGDKSSLLEDERVSNLFGVPVRVHRDDDGWYQETLLRPAK
ncbi:MAG: ATP-binding cassette domain-containing protein [Planctomycetota bacterium]